MRVDQAETCAEQAVAFRCLLRRKVRAARVRNASVRMGTVTFRGPAPGLVPPRVKVTVPGVGGIASDMG